MARKLTNRTHSGYRKAKRVGGILNFNIMKTIILLFTGLLLITTPITATETHSENLDINKRNRYAQPIMFMERGVEFLIFPDGSFDFNTNMANDYHDDMHYRSNSKRKSINANYSGPHVNIKYSSNNYGNRGVSISRDRDGRVRSIGDVFLNYDRYGKITRAGSVFINYNRGNGLLKEVGGLKVNYNRWGEIVNIRGQVNHFNNNCNICGTLSCNTNHAHNDHYFYERDKKYDDNHYYYFKQNGKVKKQKKIKK